MQPLSTGEWFCFMAEQAVIFANGVVDHPDVIAGRLAGWAGALAVAADRGSRHARALGLWLDAIVGDMDSIEAEERAWAEQAGTAFEVSPAEKNETDLELALLYAIRRGAKHIACIGALGNRLDMTIANLFLLIHPALEGARVEFWNGPQTAWLIRPPGDDVTGQPGDTLSLIPLSGPVDAVTTHALKYPLRSEPLFPGMARGVSNVLLSTRARVELSDGLLLAVHTPGRA